MATREWQIDFGPVTGSPGLITTITHRSQVKFRGEKVMATDSASPPGSQTRMQKIVVGQKLQRPALTDTLTMFFSELVAGRLLQWDICDRGESIFITVSFISAVQFDMCVFGTAYDVP